MIPRGEVERIQRLRWIFYSLLLIYILYLFRDLFLGDLDQPGRFLWTAFAILLLLLPFVFERISGMYFPWEIKIVVVLSLLLHTMGEFHRWYYTLTHYDKITHIVSAMGVAYLVFLFIILIEIYYGLEWSEHKAIFFIILMTLAFAFYWEWWEIFSDHYFGSKFFWNMQDGIGDTIANTIGAVFVAWNVSSYLRIRSCEEIANDFLMRDEGRHFGFNWKVFPLDNKEQEDDPGRCSIRAAKEEGFSGISK
jgi:hypothetical protein